ncbi:FAD-dependent oxidoreductase [Phormidium sp. CLA17]|uniref:FAD-dependent oxidoreductase n=1 Tax=Leptolyngbya sp. Cla-17 TaxID=2803751 RepID=UPI00149151A9|nr:FAD-dependent oxidoreductase [Leptolyngbya sp. Cla-17]MBM0743930.1 FAD-dependent oxidoreductase [Leptolyngbya sp. Cla-17]
METLKTDVLVVGGGTGGTAAALQAARRGANVILVSEFAWLGGMLTSAGVTAPDGNELEAWQTGIWGAFLRELERRHPEGLDHGWVSFFTYDPRVGAAIFADWVAELPNLTWIAGQVPLEVLRHANQVVGVRFADYTIYGKVTLDGTELGDLLVLGDIPHRWGWELQAEFGEPSAPIESNALTQTYPVQTPTWVMVMQDVGEGNKAAVIPAPPHYNPELFKGAWEDYGGEKFLNYGRLPGDRFMINWPIHGNDYGEGVHRLIGTESEKQQFLQEAGWHSQGFAHFIQTHLGRRYGLAENIFPHISSKSHILSDGAYALHPYYRESRRLRGLTTVRERDLLPIAKGSVAALPIVVNAQGCEQAENVCDAISIGNYANDHHYPSGDIKLAPKSIRWGGRWTGTPFTIPYRALVPETIDGFLACEKNISVSHMANGATRLQPCVLGIGQAAGMAAALCIELQCQPRDLPVRSLQEALLTDAIAPNAIIPLFNQPIDHPEWLYWQQFYLNQPDAYPGLGYAPTQQEFTQQTVERSLIQTQLEVSGVFKRLDKQQYELFITMPTSLTGQTVSLVTLKADINHLFECLNAEQTVVVAGNINYAGNWLLVEHCYIFQSQLASDQ